MSERGFYVGIDIDDTYAVASFYEDGIKEPATVSMKAGSEVFQVPLCVAKKKGLGQWFIGEEAALCNEQENVLVKQLLSSALNQDEIGIDGERYYACDLFVLFLKKLVSYIGGPYGAVKIHCLAFSVECLNAELSKLLLHVGEQMGLKKEQIVLLDRKSAFYYFALSQPKELWLHDVSLFDYREKRMKCMRLERSLNTMPQLVTIEEQVEEIESNAQDEAFYGVLSKMLPGHIVSSVYLVGDAFDGGWMDQSLNYLCRGRRAFMGKNLYAKGACYAMMVLKGNVSWPYAYIGDNEMKVNVSLAVKNRQAKEFYTLLSAGDNWYEASGSCEVILDDTREIAIWLQLPESKTANVQKLELLDLPERENKTTRLRITVTPMSDKQIKVEIKDLGFGELVKSKDQHWEYIMSL